MTQENIEQPLKATLAPKKGGSNANKDNPIKDIKKESKNVDEKTSHTSKN